LEVRKRLSIVLVAAILAGAASCGGDDEHPVKAERVPTTPEGTVPEETTTVPPEVAAALFPLTGLGTDDVNAPNHATVIAKVDARAEARPHFGINQADIVYEIRVEGVTRFIQVFHSQIPDRVGPVRSARAGDVEILSAFNKPLLAWSGGNPTVMDEVLGADRDGFIRQMAPGTAADAYWREPGRKSPHNLLVNPQALLGRVEPGGPPSPQFTYRASDEYVEGGVAVAGVTIDFGGSPNVLVDYVWDPEVKGWARYQVDSLHDRDHSAVTDVDGTQVAPANVVVLFTDYKRSEADATSPQAITVGAGDALVLTDGQMVTARWERTGTLFGYTLTLPDGKPVKLTPGRTFVALPLPGDNARPMADDLAAHLLSTS
jgi:hypothetical protein